MQVRAIRGATTLDKDEAAHLTERVQEMVREMYTANNINPQDVVSLFFTSTADIHSKYAAAAARELGLDDVPLLDAAQPTMDAMLPMCIRVMMHVNSTQTRSDIKHVFQYGAQALRADLVKQAK